MKAGWSARRITRQLGRSDCVVRRCGDQGIREMSFTRRLGSGRPRQTSRPEDRHITLKKNYTYIYFSQFNCGRGSLEVMVANSWLEMASRWLRSCSS
ncbi:uncharacterized protein TNCV_671711 [Trichonephila clavipes]|nr:uncharacterized protein TNCV_671711 [Trichonephila clavipes]